MILVRYSQMNAHLPKTAKDVRGLPVTDVSGQDLGTVADMYFDLSSKRVRFLEIVVGGFLGLGEKHYLVDAENIRLVNSRIVIDKKREEILSQPQEQTVEPLEAARRGRAAEMGAPATMAGTYTREKAPEKRVPSVEVAEKRVAGKPAVEKPAERPAFVVGREKQPKEAMEARMPGVAEEHPKRKEKEELEVVGGRRRWTDEDKASIVGKKAEHRVRAEDGFVVLEKGDTITKKQVDEAEKHHALDILMDAAGKHQ
ncbi:MAG: PRC-barrel domain-containing protein [Chloroflexota bacterium]